MYSSTRACGAYGEVDLVVLFGLRCVLLRAHLNILTGWEKSVFQIEIGL